MPGSQHTPRAPAGVRYAGKRRTLLGLLAGQRVAQADLRKPVWSNPLGRGYAEVHNPGNDTTSIVTNSTGRTYAPGTVVVAGSHAGNPGEVILGGPPAGQGGAGGAGRARPRRRPYATVPPPEIVWDAYAFAFLGDSILACLYSGGSFVADRGAVDVAALSMVSLSGNVILEDSAAAVSPGSLAFRANATTVAVWDVAGEALYTQEAASGYLAGPIAFAAGWVYWVEVADAPHDTTKFWVRLKRARADFSSASELAAHEVENTAVPVPDPDFATARTLRRTSTGCWTQVYIEGSETNGDSEVWLADGGATASVDGTITDATDGEPGPTGAAIFGGSPRSLGAHPATPAALYPAYESTERFSGNLVGETYQRYCPNGSERFAVAGNPSAIAPDATVVVGSIPSLDAPPDLYFLAVEA
jgi:hypothetical protein